MRLMARQLERTVSRVLSGIRGMRGARSGEPVSVEVALLPNRTLRGLKRKFLKKDKRVVDVLAFPEPRRFPHPERRGRFLGEVYLNAEIAARDGKRATALLVHGIVHLLGYRHGSRRDTMNMTRVEQKLLRFARTRQ